MVKLDCETVVVAALDILDEIGIEGVSTRLLAQRLGVEQPALYWHFRNKAELLAAMAGAAMAPHAAVPLPTPPDDWRTWFADNMRSFRRTLLLHRDGARLHVRSHPREADADRIAHKISFLVASGFCEQDAMMAMLAASRFTVGSVLEEQAFAGLKVGADQAISDPPIEHETAFEAGLTLIVDGLVERLRRA
jgi:TetR/AcrR family tetracycline transcriptional repressor